MPELQQAAKALLPCLRNSEADKVEMLLNEEWQTYVKSACDGVMLEACKLPDLQHQWKLQFYVPCLLKYVAQRDHGQARVCSPEPSQLYQPGDFSSPVHARRPMSPSSSTSGSPAKKQCSDHTELHDLKGSLGMKHSVIAKVLVGMPSASTILIRGDVVARYSYVLGSKSAVVECSLLGREATSVATMMCPLVGKAIRLYNAEWDGRRGMLKHTAATQVAVLPEEHELHDVAFMYTPFDSIAAMTEWSRVSLEGFVNSLTEPVTSPKDANIWIREISMSDPQQRRVKARLVSRDKDAASVLDKKADMHVQVNYAKVNVRSGTVYADLDDLTSIVQTGKDSVFRPDPSTVKEIDWNYR